MHDIYSALREFADSWGLLGLVLVFAGVVLRLFRPSAAPLYRDSALIPFRNETAPPRENARETRR
jgi:cytochrome c oxidase cbb3-type subunit IV